MKLLKITILLLIVAVLFSQTNVLQNIMRPPSAYAVGGLTVDWGSGITPGEPIFTISNMAPGDSTTKEITITNNDTSSRPVAIKGVKTSETHNLATALTITITDGSTTIYGPKSLQAFITDSQDPEGIPLSTIHQGNSRTYTITVTFNEAAGNEFQNANIAFNIIVGIAVEIPTECSTINLNGRFPIFGTSGSDTINGTTKDDVIFALEGNDRVHSGNGNDCIVGGSGNDNLDVGNGNDMVFGNEGTDRIDGGNNNDQLFGGTDADTINGGNGIDTVEGNAGKDMIHGGNESDTIKGGEDDDKVFGGNDNDVITGDGGVDVLEGGTGNDSLTGGEDIDTLNGNVGRDTCSGENLTNCELIL